MVNKCEICGITTKRKDGIEKIFMAKFPIKNEARCRIWVRNTGKEDLAYVPIEKLHLLKHVCGKHFRPQDFNKNKTHLRKTAVPTLFLTKEPLSDEILKEFPLHVHSEYLKLNKDRQKLKMIPKIENDQSYCIFNNKGVGKAHVVHQMEHDYYQSCVEPFEPETAIDNNSKPQALYERKTSQIKVSSDSMTARERKLRKELQKRKVIIRNLKKRLNKIDKISSPLIKSIIETTVDNQKRKANGRRWTDLHKSIALAIYNISPRAYAFIKEILPMPCVKTLKNTLQNTIIEPGIDPSITAHLEKEKLNQNQSRENKTNVISKKGLYNITIENMAGFEDMPEV